MKELKNITVMVIRYDDIISYKATYKAINFADASDQMRKDYKLKFGIDHHIKCEYDNIK